MFKINFVPSYADDLNYLWDLVTRRNNWFIKLRYAASMMLLIFWFYITYISGIAYSEIQNSAIMLLAFFILTYNLGFEIIKKSGSVNNDVESFNPLRFSLLQILFDLATLLTLVYFTGLIFSPFTFFFIFHAIIGSMVLAGAVVYIVFVILLLILSVLSILGFYQVIPLHVLYVIPDLSIGQTLLFISILWIILILSMMFANSLASALFQREQDLILAEKEKQRYVNTIIHELKSPVAVMTSYIDVVMDDKTQILPENTRTFLNKARDKSRGTIDLINEILEISSVNIESTEHFEVLDINEILSELVEYNLNKIETKNLKYEFLNLSGVSLKMEGNKRLLLICFSNILGNAIKYTPEGGRIICKLSKAEKEIKIEFEDNGIGILKEDMDKLFNDFQRGKNAKRAGIEGTGLGLSLTKKIILKHRGDILIESPSSFGTPDLPGTRVTMSFHI